MAVDTSEASAVAQKVCCTCGKIVSGRKRMRDSEGKYWCIPCGKADQEKKQKLIAGVIACSGCYKPFPVKKLKEYGSSTYCPACYRKVNRESGGNSGGGLGNFLTSILPADDPQTRRLILIAGALIAAGAIYLVIHFLVF